MPADLEQLLNDAARGPERPLDADALWSQGRRRRQARQVGISIGGLAAIALAVVVSGSVISDGVPVIEPLAGGEESAGDPRNREADDPQESNGSDARTTDGDSDADDSSGFDPSRETDGVPAEMDAGPLPDPRVVDDPCSTVDGGVSGAFIAVVSPVDGQQVAGDVDLVGCASVFEGTVQYRILDTAGEVVVEDFTTVTEGTAQRGVFRETVTLPADGPLTLEAYWVDVSDGSERSLVRVDLEGS